MVSTASKPKRKALHKIDIRMRTAPPPDRPPQVARTVADPQLSGPTPGLEAAAVPEQRNRDLVNDSIPTLNDQQVDVAPLAGYTVAVATERRRHPIADLLESVGARTVGIQAMRAVAAADEAALREATERCLAAPAHEVVISSSYGLRTWLAAARRWGMAEALVARFRAARLLARDPPAADSLRALGLTTIWSTAGAETEELLRYLMAQPLRGRRIVIQINRGALQDGCHALAEAGADVVVVPTYRPSPPPHAMILRRLIDLVTRRQVDAVAFAGPPTAEYLLAQAEREGRLDDLLAALREDVLCLALGPLTAAPLLDRDVPVRLAARPYREDLAEEVLTRLPERSLRLVARGHLLEVRGQAVLLDGRLIALPGGPLAVLRALASRPGRVLSATDIRGSAPVWGDVDDHAVEMAVSRLRRLLGESELVQTIVKRGYRLAV